MNRARVIGYATSVMKHESLTGYKMLIAVPVTTDGDRPDGEPAIVFDALGAGIGDLVLITSDGSYTGGDIIGTRITPARWGVVGIIDSANKKEDE
ncbi:MAG: ethanolamine utilization protein EutN [Thermoguttaceae bacterium]|nr:ethanolamine utilization protein EutN [Thermoguttaceae bacterium]